MAKPIIFNTAPHFMPVWTERNSSILGRNKWASRVRFISKHPNARKYAPHISSEKGKTCGIYHKQTLATYVSYRKLEKYTGHTHWF